MTTKQNQPASVDQRKKQSKFIEVETSKSHIYACFQQPQTVQILKYITQSSPNKLLFDSAPSKNLSKSTLSQDDKNNSILKRVKQFKFDKIYNRQEKFKYAFSSEIRTIIAKLFRGHSQTVFIYGTQESKKDKILIGQSQNAGLLLATLSEIFDYCHDKEIQDEVTIKISCSMFKDGKFVDPFNLAQNLSPKEEDNKKQQFLQSEWIKSCQEEEFENTLCDDMIQGKYLLGTPQIIIRNMRTALKIINLITKKIQQRRDMKEQNTQNILFTIKLQLDTAYDRQTTGQVYEYCIPKLYIVKLANPSIDNTLNGVNKNNRWFINLFNFLQNEVLQEKGLRKSIGDSVGGTTKGNHDLQKGQIKDLTQFLLTANPANSKSAPGQNQASQLDETSDNFTEYIKNVVMKSVSDIHCFTSINNKMTSNECLTAFIFNNYLSSYQTKPHKTVLNMHTLKNEKNNFEDQLMNLFIVREVESQREKEITEKYRAKYRILVSSGNSVARNTPNSMLRTASNTAYNKPFSQTQKIKQPLSKDTLSSTKPEKLGLSQSQSLKKSSQQQQSLPLPPSPDSIKQALKPILAPQSQQPQTQEPQWQVKLLLLNYIDGVKQFMNCFNLVEYEYAQILAQGCEKLNKYIFNQEIEEFYYAKKISLQHSVDLRLALKGLAKQKAKTQDLEDKIIKKLNNSIKKTSNELQILNSINGRHEHQQFFKVKKTKILTLIKQKNLIQKLFEFYNTTTYHYVYEDNPKLLWELQQTKQRVQQEFQKRVMNESVVNYEEIMKNIKKGFNQRIKEMRGDAGGTTDNGNGGRNKTEITEKGEEDEQDTRFLDESSVGQTNQVTRNEARSILSETHGNTLQNFKLSKAHQQASVSMHTEKKKDPIQELKEKASKYKTRKATNQLDNMFTNSNVGVVRPQFQRKNYK